jgi:hypothetical protein
MAWRKSGTSNQFEQETFFNQDSEVELLEYRKLLFDQVTLRYMLS